MDVIRIEQMFLARGFNVEVIEFSKLNFNFNYKDYFVLYQTSETIGQFYKKYIEDIVYYLQMNGAIVLPQYKYLKAHHNKGFMELLRNTFVDESLKTISSKYYGAYIEALDDEPKLPVVIKQISGSGSTGVYCAKSNREYEKYVRKSSRTIIGNDYYNLFSTEIKDKIKKSLSIINHKYYSKVKKNICRSFIVQNFIQELSGDYKVLYFGGKYYTLYRENRKNDFRASGGGRLQEVPMEENKPLLDFARKLVLEIDFPIIGMDIGFDGSKYHLIEFQMIHLGPYTLQRSDYYFLWKDNKWECINEKSDLEEEFTRSIYEYIENKYKVNDV
jgi:hypothetical protein